MNGLDDQSSECLFLLDIQNKIRPYDETSNKRMMNDSKIIKSLFWNVQLGLIQAIT
ncbi:MAG: hypothetical protein MHMPM18_003131, partial [Marteilia pararefringens]